MGRTTILDAVVMVLDHVPRSANEIYQRIVEKALYDFKTQHPVAMVRSAIQRHLRTHGGAGQTAARVRLVAKDRYIVA